MLEERLNKLVSKSDTSSSTQSATKPASEEIEHLVILFNQCRYAEAEVLARHITERFPMNGFGWKALGAVFRLQGYDAESLECIKKAVALSPGDPEAHYNLGVIFKDLGLMDEAESSYRLALEIKTDYAEAHNNLGVILNDMGRMEEAEASYRLALEAKPDYAEAHNNLGVTLKDLGRMDEAESSYRRALKIKPDYAGAHNNLGNTLRDLGRLDEALENFRLSINHEKDREAALRYLTTPTILLTGMAMGFQYKENLEEPRNQKATLRGLVENSAASTLSLAAQGELRMQEAGSTGPEPKRNLRIILIYPPPWQIPSPGYPLTAIQFAPPRERNDHDLDEGFQTITYGLLTIAAQAKRSGYDVRVYNLSICPWRNVVNLIADTEADVYGISAFTANRRGMGALAALIRQYHPQTHITVGGPFVTALPFETLRYFRDIDTAVIGEGEATFMELLECLGSGRPAVGIPGTAWRSGEEIALGPTRPRINDLDALASPFDYFTSHIVMTSRGCPSKCTFCGSFTTWGKKLRFQSAESCLNTFRKALARLPVPFIAIKDDTFTANRQRAMAICDAIIESNMNFIWSCDTRVDCLNDELLCKMRLAGCQMISLGVESGSPEILKTMCKETTPEMVLKATRDAQKYGMYVRYYMILINRGETTETIQQSNNLIKAGRPDSYFFCPMSYYPGTEDWAILCEKQGLTPDIFFRNDFKELNVATNRHKEFGDFFRRVLCDIGTINGFNYTVEERKTVAERLPHLHSVHVELANAYFQNGQLDEAESSLDRAEELNFPISGIIENQRACISLARGEEDKSLALLESAFQSKPNNLVMNNLKNLRVWADTPVIDRGKPPVLSDSVLALDYIGLHQTPFCVRGQRLLPLPIE